MIEKSLKISGWDKIRLYEYYTDSDNNLQSIQKAEMYLPISLELKIENDTLSYTIHFWDGITAKYENQQTYSSPTPIIRKGKFKINQTGEDVFTDLEKNPFEMINFYGRELFTREYYYSQTDFEELGLQCWGYQNVYIDLDWYDKKAKVLRHNMITMKVDSNSQYALKAFFESYGLGKLKMEKENAY